MKTETKAEVAEIAMTAIDMLEGILTSIVKQADDHSTIKSLAKTGQYIASDQHNFLDCLREEAEKEAKQ